MRSVFYPTLVNGPFGDPALYVRLAHRGEALLFDCGDLHALSTREILKLSAIFVSHGHIDHLVGFDLLLRNFLCSRKPLVLYGPPGFSAQIGHRLAGYTWNLIESYPLTVIVREWGEEGGTEVRFRAAGGFRAEGRKDWLCSGGLLVETPAFRVRCVPLDHGGIVSLAFVLEEPLHVAVHKDALESRGYAPGPWLNRFKDLVQQGGGGGVDVPLAAGGSQPVELEELCRQIAHTERGMKLCYVTDASPSAENLQAIETLAADAHFLAIEATFAQCDYSRAVERNHLTAALAGEVARRARAARLLVFHHSPRYHDDPERLRLEAEGAFAAGD
jgi:ribonuclease Z